LAKRVDGVVTQIGPPQQFQVTVEGQESMSSSDHAALVEFQTKVMRLQRAANRRYAGGHRPQAATRRDQARDFGNAFTAAAIAGRCNAIDKRVADLQRALSGDNAARQRNINTPPSINDRISYVVGAQRMSISRPTQTQINQYNAAAQDFEACSANCDS
jgi:hypothetical protein